MFLVGLSEGLMPISFADTPEAVDEERRLLYVGITRAREHLSLSWSTARTPGGRANRKPSRFLDGLRPDSVASSSCPGQGPGAAPQGCRPGVLPGLRQHAVQRRRTEGGPLQPVPAQL